MKYLICFLCLIVFETKTEAQSKTIQNLKDSSLVQLGLYFSPSTLRMLNLQKDKSYDEMIKGIKKMNVLIMKPNKFTQAHYFETIDDLTQQEGYEEYIIWDGAEYELQVLGKAKKQEIIGLANYNESYYVFNLKGTIDLMKLPEFYERVTTQDSTGINGFNYVFDMIKKDDDQRIRREKRRKDWEERQKKEAAAKSEKDSLSIEIN